MPNRLLVVSDTLTGGEGALAAFHAETARRHGWEVTVAAPSASDAVALCDGHAELSMPSTARDLPGLRRAGRALGALTARLSPDVVHCHGARCFVAARMAGVRRPFVSLHGIQPVTSDPPGYRAVRRAGLALLPRSAAGAFDDGPNGMPGWRFVPHASPGLATLPHLGPPTADRPTFLWLGRLDEPKRPDLFVRAMAQLARRHPDARGLVAGTGPLQGALVALIDALGAPVELLGHRADVANVLAQATAVALFSSAEGVPLSLQEAMWTGRPVVASPLPGTRFLAGRRGGILTDDLEGIVAALARLCDATEAARMGAEAADEVRTLVQPDDPWPALAEAYAPGNALTREPAWR